MVCILSYMCTFCPEFDYTEVPSVRQELSLQLASLTGLLCLIMHSHRMTLKLQQESEAKAHESMALRMIY